MKVITMAPNQFIVYGDTFTLFQSYNSIIAKHEKGQTFLDTRYWNYSKTAGKYRNRFLGEDKKTTERKIQSGEYILTDLN